MQRFDRKTEHYEDFHLSKGHDPVILNRIVAAEPGLVYGLEGAKLHCYAIRGDSLEEQPLQLPSGLQVTDIRWLNGLGVLLTSNEGLWRLAGHGEFGGLGRILVEGGTDPVNHIGITSRGRLLLSSRSRLLLVSAALPGGVVRVLHEYREPGGEWLGQAAGDDKGEYWVSTGRRLTRLDSALRPIQTIEPSDAPTGLHASDITDVFIDRSQCLWVATFGHGVNYCDLNEKLFFTIQPEEGVANSLGGNIVKSILDENGERLWIGTDKGLNRYDYKTGRFSFYNDGSAGVTLKGNNVSALLTDREGRLWVGDASGIEVLDASRRSLMHLPGSENFPRHLIETLAQDCYGNIWFGNHNDPSGVILRGDDGAVKYHGEGFFIFADGRRPVILISSTKGLTRLLVDEHGNVLQSDTIRARRDGPALSSNYTYPIRKIDDSEFWVGTIGGGLDNVRIDEQSGRFTVKTYGEEEGVFLDVESIETGDSGKVWMGGHGLLCMDTSMGTVVRYDKNDGLLGNSFKVNASYKAVDGRLFFGGIGGLNYFNPADIQLNPVPARPAFTEISINNRPVVYAVEGPAENSLPVTLGFTDRLKLDHLQNNFVIGFSAMHFANPLKCRYRYRLTGYDPDWNYTNGLNPTAAYSNLDYGAYTFIVEATNNDGIWSGSAASMPILVMPPWWKSYLAKWIYAILILSVLTGIYIYQGRWYRLKRKMAIAAVKERKREEMHLQKEELYRQQLDFFANISHELRTPLTLISAPLEGMIRETKSSPRYGTYEMMFRNVKRLTNLLNELMNFKKVADGVIRLRVEEISLAALCEDLYDDFKVLADRKSIDLSFVNRLAGDNGYFDRQVVEKILINLLYNALKYTQPGGSIQLELLRGRAEFVPSFVNEYLVTNTAYTAGDYVYLLIRDTGIGITRESMSNIFDRYYRISNEQIGSGVGLALVKSLTLLHKGTISVYSEPSRGTEILVGLPWGVDEYGPDEQAIRQDLRTQPRLEPIDTSIVTAPVIPEQDDQTHDRSAKRILVVEDNPELCHFLCATLGKTYGIYAADNGKTGMAVAIERIPDLIISDVMMPEMDGIALCRQIKSTFETSHIPFLILSARDAIESQIAGMESGADYYLSKPVSVELLQLMVKNVFEHRERLRARYAKDYLTQATELVQTNKDKAFMQDLLNLIEENIQEPELDIDFLCGKLFTSRTQLYLKIKSITGQSTGEFIKTVRIKKAIQIMTQEDVPLSVVAERIGLQSASYFSRVFRKAYGQSPSEFMQGIKGGPV
jgi:signal transduction histidine kinase/DNA-binding response OmpR family regulator/ligand-binding sensor domain-containing protein